MGAFKPFLSDLLEHPLQNIILLLFCIGHSWKQELTARAKTLQLFLKLLNLVKVARFLSHEIRYIRAYRLSKKRYPLLPLFHTIHHMSHNALKAWSSNSLFVICKFSNANSISSFYARQDVQFLIYVKNTIVSMLNGRTQLSLGISKD